MFPNLKGLWFNACFFKSSVSFFSLFSWGLWHFFHTSWQILPSAFSSPRISPREARVALCTTWASLTSSRPWWIAAWAWTRRWCFAICWTAKWLLTWHSFSRRTIGQLMWRRRWPLWSWKIARLFQCLLLRLSLRPWPSSPSASMPSNSKKIKVSPCFCWRSGQIHCLVEQLLSRTLWAASG